MHFLFMLLALSEPSTIDDEAIQEQLLQRAASQFQISLKDSQSARFMTVYFRSTIGIDKRKYWSICGLINSKNSYGAYTGFQVFLANQVDGRFNLIIDNGRDQTLARSACAPDRGTWLLDRDLSQQLSKMVTRSE